MQKNQKEALGLGQIVLSYWNQRECLTPALDASQSGIIKLSSGYQILKRTASGTKKEKSEPSVPKIWQPYLKEMVANAQKFNMKIGDHKKKNVHGLWIGKDRQWDCRWILSFSEWQRNQMQKQNSDCTGHKLQVGEKPKL